MNLSCNKLAKFILTTIAFLVTSCGRNVSVNDIPGVYRITYSFGEETLTIKPNGGFTQSIKLVTDAVPIVADGKWGYSQSEKEIKLTNRMMVHDGYGKLNLDFKSSNRAVSILSVKKGFLNHVVIISSADGYGFDYHKVDN